MKGAILLINGPNLNLLGTREPEIYGETTLADIQTKLKANFSAQGFELVAYQSNQEGQLIDFIQEHQTAKFAIINAGAFTHTSVALRDAIKGVGLKFLDKNLTFLTSPKGLLSVAVYKAMSLRQILLLLSLENK